jgi:uncharacterized membrane protein
MMNSSCKGYSSDFALIGFVGFYFLLWNQLEGYVDPRSEAGDVGVMDLTFALGATIFSSISYMQTFIYPNEKATLPTQLVVGGCVAYFLVCSTLQAGFHRLGEPEAVSLLTVTAVIKALSTASKYIYQMVLNHNRKSTKGLSNVAIISDFIGASCALAQL